MSWLWGGKKTEEPPPSSDPFADGSSFGAPPGGDFGQDFGSSGGRGGSVGGSSGGGQVLSQAALGGLQEILEAEQQKMAVGQVIGKLTELAFEACVEKPSTSLSSSEERCIRGSVFKYMDTSEFVVGRFAKSQQPPGRH